MAIANLKSDPGRGVFVQKQRANIYSMMLILALLFIMIGNLALYLELKAYDMKVKPLGNETAASVQRPQPTTNPATGL